MSMSRTALYNAGLQVVRAFCKLNKLVVPECTVLPPEFWVVNACAFYRPGTELERKYRLPHHGPDINICLDECAWACGHQMSRAWSWPGNTVDRTPFGVICHEAAHHADWHRGTKKGRYYSDHGEGIKTASGNDEPLTTYAATNPAEWFAEAMRLFMSNPDLLLRVRPRTYEAIRKHWTPLGGGDWRQVLNMLMPCPDRVVTACQRKFHRRYR